MFVQVSTDNHLVTDADANGRLEDRVRQKLRRFEARLTHVEVHVCDANGAKGGGGDKRASLEARGSGHEPVAVHAEAPRVELAVTAAADKALRALDHAFARQKSH